MGKRKKSKQSLTRSAANLPVPTEPRSHYYLIDEYGYIISAQQEPLPRSLDHYPATEPAMKPKPAGVFDSLHLAMPAKQLAESQPKAKVESVRPYTSETPPPIKALPSADAMVPCPYCNRQGPRSQLKRHIKDEHMAPPGRPRVLCPHCNVQVHQSNLAAHIAKAHQAQLATAKAAPKLKAPNAIPVANRPLRTDLTVCPICNVSVRSDRLDRHLHKVHQQDNRILSLPPSSETANHRTEKSHIFCHICNVSIKPSNLAHHLLKVHKQPISAMSSGVLNKVSGQRNQVPEHPSIEEKSQAAFDQAFHEARFGDKYIGHMRRESSGRFGSLPLYDDYGDDADAD